MDKSLSMVSMTGVSSVDVCSDMVHCSLSFIFCVCASGYICMFLIESLDDFYRFACIFDLSFCRLFDVLSDGLYLFVFLVLLRFLLAFSFGFLGFCSEFFCLVS